MGQEKRSDTQSQIITQEQLRQIRELAGTLRYGTITLVFQDGVLIQIEKSEKIRISKA